MSEESIPEKVFSFNLFHYNKNIQNAVKNVVDSSLSVCERFTVHKVKYSVDQIICIKTYFENRNCLLGKIMLILFGQNTYFIVKQMVVRWDYDALYELQDENLPVVCIDIKIWFGWLGFYGVKSLLVHAAPRQSHNRKN